MKSEKTQNEVEGLCYSYISVSQKYTNGNNGAEFRDPKKRDDGIE